MKEFFIWVGFFVLVIFLSAVLAITLTIGEQLDREQLKQEIRKEVKEAIANEAA